MTLDALSVWDWLGLAFGGVLLVSAAFQTGRDRVWCAALGGYFVATSDLWDHVGLTPAVVLSLQAVALLGIAIMTWRGLRHHPAAVRPSSSTTLNLHSPADDREVSKDLH